LHGAQVAITIIGEYGEFSFGFLDALQVALAVTNICRGSIPAQIRLHPEIICIISDSWLMNN
jgi:hypothetical protein